MGRETQGRGRQTVTIRMIYYGLSEGLGNDCWKFSFANTYIHLILKYIKIEHIFKIVVLFHNILVFAVF